MSAYMNQSLRVEFNIGIDTTGATDIQLKYKSPDMVTGLCGPITISNVQLGDCYIDLPVDFLNQVGDWKFWSAVDTIDGTFYGTPIDVEIVIESQSIVTLDGIKSYLGITTDEYDGKIITLVPAVEQKYLDIRNIPFRQTSDGVLKYPGNYLQICYEMIGYKLSTTKFSTSSPFGAVKQSESIDAYSVSYGDILAGGIDGYPKSIVGDIKRFMDGR